MTALLIGNRSSRRQQKISELIFNGMESTKFKKISLRSEDRKFLQQSL